MQTHISPLILTLELDAGLFAVLNKLRQAHFPPERNLIPAHVTLFHALPDAAIIQIRSDLTALAACTAPFSIILPSVRFLGRGVALEVVSPELSALRRDLGRRWKDWLSAQDRQGYRPHVTIQNKVSAERARHLHAELADDWQALHGWATGLRLWHYRGGPWELADAVHFAATTA